MHDSINLHPSSLNPMKHQDIQDESSDVKIQNVLLLHP